MGKLPKAAMGHNWVLLRPDTDLASFAMSAMKAKDNEYVPVGAPEVMVNTILLGGGEKLQLNSKHLHQVLTHSFAAFQVIMP